MSPPATSCASVPVVTDVWPDVGWACGAASTDRIRVLALVCCASGTACLVVAGRSPGGVRARLMNVPGMLGHTVSLGTQHLPQHQGRKGVRAQCLHARWAFRPRGCREWQRDSRPAACASGVRSKVARRVRWGREEVFRAHRHLRSWGRSRRPADVVRLSANRACEHWVLCHLCCLHTAVAWLACRGLASFRVVCCNCPVPTRDCTSHG